VIQGNYIGTDFTGNNAVPNSFGGIYFYGSGTNLVGGAVQGAGNIISGNYQEGLSIGYGGANGNTIQGNFIGTKADGVSPLGNQLHNIDFHDTASNNLVGGSTPAADNHIAFVQNSSYDGVRIRAGCLGNFVSRNSIFSNGFLGIVIGSIAGVNTSNMVVLTEAVSAGETTGVQGTLSTYPNGQFLIQFYDNIAPNPSGYGEGLTYLGSTSIMTGATGTASFVASLPMRVTPGTYVSATATDSANTTWEFCADIQVVSPPSLSISQPSGGGSGPITITWPSTPPNFILQDTTNLNPPAIWSSATNTVTANGTTNSITFTPTDPPTAMFFRLLFQ